MRILGVWVWVGCARVCVPCILSSCNVLECVRSEVVIDGGMLAERWCEGGRWAEPEPEAARVPVPEPQMA